MSLPSSIAASARRMAQLTGELRGYLAELRGLHARRSTPASATETGDAETRALTNASVMGMCLMAELEALRVALAADASTGGAARVMPAMTIAMSLARMTEPLPTARMLASLHRAGDHTMDEGVEP